MNSIPVVHIGAPKTGTTMLQQQLFTDQSRFYSLGRFGVGGDQCIDPCLRELIWEGLYLDERAWLSKSSQFIEAVRTHIKAAQERGLKPVISNEAISMNYYVRADFYARFSRLKELLGENATILLLTRRQDKWMKSFYSSLVCDAGASMSFRTFYEINCNMPLSQYYVMSSLDYSHIIDSARRHFTNVHAMPFELLLSNPSEGKNYLQDCLE